MRKLLFVFLAVALCFAGYYGIKIPRGLDGFSVGDCLTISGDYVYRVEQLGKYSIRTIKAIGYSDHNDYEPEILYGKDLKEAYLADCFDTFDTYNKQGERK
jgi:hypothetical protein